MAPEVAVNCIAPGLVENTRMAKRLPEAIARGAADHVVSLPNVSAKMLQLAQSD